MYRFVRVLSTLLILLSTASLLAETPYSITPTSGPSTGGTEVTIKGDFGDWPYGVIFGSTPVQATKVDAHTLTAVTPAHLPGPADVTIFEYDIGIPTGVQFQFVGGTESFERVLLPILSPPVNGAFGAQFHTDLRIANKGNTDWLEVFGVREPCPLPVPDCTIEWDKPIEVARDAEKNPEQVEYNGTPGRFVFVTKQELSSLAMNLRVYDVTRAALNFGTEIPVVRETEFVNDRIVLTGVPTDPRFRNTLRIYAKDAFWAHVKVGDRPSQRIRVEPQQPVDLFQPAYAIFNDFPIGDAPVRVTIDAEPDFQTVLPVETPFWAFITVTNNDTQVITTITPQP